MVITTVKKGSPDMILTAFDWKFQEKKNELPPEACRLQKTLDKLMMRKREDPHHRMWQLSSHGVVTLRRTVDFNTSSTRRVQICQCI